jgi:hypothetical protein
VLAPLPETAGEVCDVAHDVKADVARDMRLGARSTEGEVKRLSASGELAEEWLRRGRTKEWLLMCDAEAGPIAISGARKRRKRRKRRVQ